MSGHWGRYYDAAGDAPRETLLFALDRFEAEREEGDAALLAVDLGCGTGRDTAELLRRGWRVLAVDAEEEAIERLRARLGRVEGSEGRLTTTVSRFESVRLPRAALVNASFALPFIPPPAFPAVWERIRTCLVAGGRFCGQLFGDRDGWVADVPSWSKEGEITFHTRGEVEELLGPFEVERLREIEEDGETAVGDPKHWHLFDVVVRKP